MLIATGPMAAVPTALCGAHYVLRARQDEDLVEIQVYATPEVIARLTGDRADEARVIEVAVAYLIARQRPDDLHSWTLTTSWPPMHRGCCAPATGGPRIRMT